MHSEVSETRRRRRRRSITGSRTNDVMKDIDQRATHVVRKPRRTHGESLWIFSIRPLRLAYSSPLYVKVGLTAHGS